jgi:predicted Zn-dependent peptidase
MDGGNMRKILSVLLFVLTTGSLVWAGKTTIYTLPNGMEVILKENHSTPLVSSVIVVKAGSKYESEQNNGFTHLLEHMLFNGTETRGREQIDEGVKDHGGYINAFTRQEITGYLIVMPKEFMDFGLDIQSDQLFHSTLPESQFPKERDIVAEEIKKDNDNVDNAASDFFNSVIFAGTPYARPVIGYESTIRNVTRDEVMKYYKEHYVPANMTALIIGDFETALMQKLVEKFFGNVPKSNPPQLPVFQISPPFGTEIKVKKFPTKTTFIQISVPAPLYSDPDYYAYDVMTQILNSGESSPLAKVLTSGEKPLANDISASLDVQKEYTMMNISIQTDKPENVDTIVTAAINVLKELPPKKFTVKDINRVVIPNKVEEIKLEEKLHYYGIMKAPFLATCGYGFLENYVDNLSAVTPENVSAVAQKYFINPKYVACALEPAPEVE